ncbi:MAG: ribose-5-phosphate isomerase A [Deltaproteobacteria bacterium]|nr:ribose-5-phosphate isomerase A [Deltaproteobacteria bacterium]
MDELFNFNEAVIGIGTGRTVTGIITNQFPKNFWQKNFFVPSSFDSEVLLMTKNAKILSLSSVKTLDLYIDGADWIHLKERMAIKGYGGAMFKEKVCYLKARRNILFVNSQKICDTFDNLAIPFEVNPACVDIFMSHLEKFDCEFQIRQSQGGKFGSVITENGFVIVDVKFKQYSLEGVQYLSNCLGVLCSGLFFEKPHQVFNLDTMNFL